MQGPIQGSVKGSPEHMLSHYTIFLKPTERCRFSNLDFQTSRKSSDGTKPLTSLTAKMIQHPSLLMVLLQSTAFRIFLWCMSYPAISINAGLG